MPSRRNEEIQDEKLRGLMNEAQVALNADDFLTCVRRCADAYLYLLNTRPAVMEALKAVLATDSVRAGLASDSIRFAPVMWPRLAAKLHMSDDGTPSIVFDRERLSFTETTQYQEFTLTLIIEAEHGLLSGPTPGLF